MAKKEIATVLIKRLGINGEGIAYYKNQILFVKGALPKEKVRVEITKKTPQYSQGKLVKILKASKDRIVPPCAIYEECGGCQLQHLQYQAQLAFKKDLLKQALHKFKPQGYENFILKETIGMEDPWYYRNKAQFPVRKVAGKIIAGLFKENSHELVSLTNCLVQIPLTQQVANEIVALLEKYNLPIYYEGKKGAAVKTIVLRTKEDETQLQVVFVTNTSEFPHQKEIIAELCEKFAPIVSIMQNIQPSKSSLIFGETTKNLWGEDVIHEELGEVAFDLSPRAFFQLNPKQTKVLYAEVEKALELKSHETLVDAYCGVGTIGLTLAKKVKEVRGMDVIPEAISNAKENAKHLNLTNTHYEVGSAEVVIPRWFQEGFIPDALVVDPPRTGLDEKLRTTLLNYPPKKLVYVSCNVSTLALDLKTLGKVYQVDYLQSVDMFPQTARCEVVVKLTRK